MADYLFDANVFISAKNSFLTFKLAPQFWEWFEGQFVSNNIGSTKEVYDELTKRKDDISGWVKRNRKYFVDQNRAALEVHRDLHAWAIQVPPTDEPSYTAEAWNDFASCADIGIVAMAKVTSSTVVTRETRSTKKSIIKIPDAADAIGVSCITPEQFLESQKAQFTISSKNDLTLF